ncbi:hypothetical protein GGR53DRAFT_513888 [Hypoxylon sp. FL1150]|nr:hypothetical protein GGR53DRAFT_513888 [Hypoxylon sp. FL1150]
MPGVSAGVLDLSPSPWYRQGCLWPDMLYQEPGRQDARSRIHRSAPTTMNPTGSSSRSAKHNVWGIDWSPFTTEPDRLLRTIDINVLSLMKRDDRWAMTLVDGDRCRISRFPASRRYHYNLLLDMLPACPSLPSSKILFRQTSIRTLFVSRTWVGAPHPEQLPHRFNPLILVLLTDARFALSQNGSCLEAICCGDLFHHILLPVLRRGGEGELGQTASDVDD